MLCDLLYSGHKIPDRCVVDNFLIQRKRKLRTFSIDALNLQPAAKQSQQLNGDTHAKAGSLDVAVPVLLNALKFRRKPGQILLPDTNPRVLHFKHQRCCLIRLTASHPKPHSSLVRIFDRIGQNVGQYLPNAHIIAIQPGRNPGIDLHLKRNIFIFCPLQSHIRQVMYHTADVILYRHNLHLTRLDL